MGYFPGKCFHPSADSNTVKRQVGVDKKDEEELGNTPRYPLPAPTPYGHLFERCHLKKKATTLPKI